MKLFNVFSISFLSMLLSSTVHGQSNKAVIKYYGDPMCSWCYGASEEIRQLKTHFESEMDFEVVMGGLRPYNTQTMTDLKSFLTEHWHDVHKASGQEFCYEILDSTTITYDTEPPCRAVVLVKDIDPSQTFAFFKLIQKEFYKENKNMHLVESYNYALDALNIDSKRFEERFDTQEAKNAVQLEFKASQEAGVRGFPTIMLEWNGSSYLIANGYAKAQTMISSINRIMSNTNN